MEQNKYMEWQEVHPQETSDQNKTVGRNGKHKISEIKTEIERGECNKKYNESGFTASVRLSQYYTRRAGTTFSLNGLMMSVGW